MLAADGDAFDDGCDEARTADLYEGIDDDVILIRSTDDDSIAMCVLVTGSVWQCSMGSFGKRRQTAADLENENRNRELLRHRDDQGQRIQAEK